MIPIIISGTISIILSCIVMIWIVRFFKKKLNGEKPSIVPIIILGLGIAISGVFCVYSLVAYLADNKDKIADLGQEVISKSVEYTSTAVFEGLGKTIDHFEEKWKDEYLNALDQIELEVVGVEYSEIDSLSQMLILEIEFQNPSDQSTEIHLSTLENKEYLLVGDSATILYPLTFREGTGKLVKGKSRHYMQATVQHGIQPAYLHVGKRKVSINNQKQ